MSATLTVSQRLQRLGQILADSKPTVSTFTADDRDAAARHLESVPFERIRRITADLLERGDSRNDDVDALAIRLLLNDYMAAVAHLRAVVRDAGRRIDAAAEPISATRRFVWRDEKLQAAKQQALDDALPE